MAESGPRGGKSDANWLFFLRTLPCIKVLYDRLWGAGLSSNLSGFEKVPHTLQKWQSGTSHGLISYQFIWITIGKQGHYEPQVRGEWEQQGAVRVHQASVTWSFKIIMKDSRQKNINLLPPGWVNPRQIIFLKEQITSAVHSRLWRKDTEISPNQTSSSKERLLRLPQKDSRGATTRSIQHAAANQVERQ